MAEIFLYKHEAGINAQQLQKLRRAGYIPVGVRFIDDVKILEAPVPLSQANADLILLAACRAIKRDTTGFSPKYFGEALATAIVADAEALRADEA